MKISALFQQVILLLSIKSAIGSEDKYIDFLILLSSSANKQCPDKTLLLPDCMNCIPGLIKEEGSSSCNKYSESSKNIRDEIKQLTDERYPQPAPHRPFGLYPYLESPEFLKRQEKFGSWLSENNATVS